jgi:hypothetical protein
MIMNIKAQEAIKEAIALKQKAKDLNKQAKMQSRIAVVSYTQGMTDTEIQSDIENCKNAIVEHQSKLDAFLSSKHVQDVAEVEHWIREFDKRQGNFL